MLYVYRRAASDSANILAEAVDGRRWRARDLPMERKVRPGDAVVCWGEALTVTIPNVKILNGAPIRSKYDDAMKLRAAQIPTVEVSRVRPPTPTPVPAGPDRAAEIYTELQEQVEAFRNIIPENIRNRNAVLQQGVTQFIAGLDTFRAALRVPVPVAVPVTNDIWLPRSNSHVGGNDLLTPTRQPDYFSKKLELVREFRIHSFLKKSIRAGVKAPREGYEGRAHQWIRSWDGGWRILYDGVTSKKKHRDLAHAACEALGLEFGAVDIGEQADGSLIVLEANRAPGLEGGTVSKYADAIINWRRGRVTGE